MSNNQSKDSGRIRYSVCWPYFVGSDNPIPYLFEKIAPFIAEDEFNITVFSNQRGSVINQELVTEIYTHKPHTLRRRARVLMTLLQEYDLIHTGGNPAKQYPMARLSHLRNQDINHIHTFRIDQPPDMGQKSAKKEFLVEKADAVTAVSEHTAKTIEEAFGTRPQVIYNGVDPDVFKPGYDRPELFESLEVSAPVFLFVGSLDRRKRPSAVIEVAQKVPEVTFLIIGTGSRMEALERAATGVSNVHLVGRLEKRRLPPIYANATGFVFPSVKEGCPNVVLEAMASETPVVGYEATSMPELVTNGETGYLVPTDDVDALAKRIRTVSSADGLGANAREYVLRNHTFDKIAHEYKDVYRSVVADC